MRIGVEEREEERDAHTPRIGFRGSHNPKWNQSIYDSLVDQVAELRTDVEVIAPELRLRSRPAGGEGRVEVLES